MMRDDLCWLYSFHRQPLAADKSPDEHDHPEEPVDRHGDPDTHNAHSKAGEGDQTEEADRLLRENVAERDAEGPHGEHRDDQRKADVARGAEGGRQGKGDRPYQHGADRMVEDQAVGQRG